MATTLDQLYLAHQIAQNLVGLKKDIRDNAANAKLRLAAGQDPLGVADMMARNAGEYLRRLGWITAQAPKDMTDALTAAGVDMAEANGLHATLLMIAAQQQADCLAARNAADIAAMADQVLASTPEAKVLW